MDTEILARLNGINQEFYQTFADSFSQTRGRIQPGVRRILERMPKRGDFLDIGCGNGNLGRVWSQMGYRGTYTGIDFSPGLIAVAKNIKKEMAVLDQSITFFEADLSSDAWISVVPEKKWDAIFCFAVLHHIPSIDRRLRLCRQMNQISSSTTQVWISVWQPLHSLRLQKRIIDWHDVDIDTTRLERGDVLMDWRAYQSGPDKPALRYVHIFDQDELSTLAQQAGFVVRESFFSDGKEGNLGLYQHWVTKD